MNYQLANCKQIIQIYAKNEFDNTVNFTQYSYFEFRILLTTVIKNLFTILKIFTSFINL